MEDEDFFFDAMRTTGLHPIIIDENTVFPDDPTPSLLLPRRPPPTLQTRSPAMVSLPTPRDGPSPFLEGTAIQWAWDSTCLGWLKACPRRYQLSFIEGWQPRDRSVHLTFGILYTEALDRYDKARAAAFRAGEASYDHEQALRDTILTALMDTWIDGDINNDPSDGHPWEHGQWDTKIGNKNRFTLIRTIIWHLDQFGESDPAQTVIDEAGEALAERSFRMELDWGPEQQQLIETPPNYWPGAVQYTKPIQPYVLCGHLDRVVSFLGGIYGMDHKTTKSTIGDYYFDQWEPNNQMSLYTIAVNVIFHTPAKGIIIDAAQIAVGFSRFARGMTYRTPAQSEEWLYDLRYWLAAAESYATEGYWPMNDTACTLCDFNKHDSKICAKDPSVREAFLKSSFTKENPWNPLQTR